MKVFSCSSCDAKHPCVLTLAVNAEIPFDCPYGNHMLPLANWVEMEPKGMSEEQIRAECKKEMLDTFTKSAKKMFS